jgi:hypothetical protein
VVEIVGKVMAFANGNGYTLQVQRVAKATSLGRSQRNSVIARVTSISRWKKIKLILT